jgi:peroxiredoxin
MPSTPAAPARRPAATARQRANRRRWLWAGAVAAAIVLASSAVALRGQPAASDGTDPAAATPVELVKAGGGDPGEQAPQFTATTTAGTQFSLPAGKPAVVFFMAGWCTSCYAEAQALARIEQQHGDKVSILAVSPDPSDSLAAIRRFAEQVGAEYGFAHDVTGTLAQALGARSLDTTVVVDAAGRVVYRDGHPTDEATLRTALAQAGLT